MRRGRNLDDASPGNPQQFRWVTHYADSCETLYARMDMGDDEPKSAWELALERFRKQDAEQGTEEQVLTPEQKAAIEECHRSYKAKVAELEIMHQSKLATARDAESREKLQIAYRRDLERAAEDRDRMITRIRVGR